MPDVTLKVSFLGDFAPLPRAARRSGLAMAEAGGAPPVVVTNFVMETQKFDQWCWAATAVSVARKYKPTSSWTQCKIASSFYAAQGEDLKCCSDDEDTCNRPQALSQVFPVTGNLAGNAISDPIAFADLLKELKADRPVCVRIGWPPDNELGHFIAVTGARTAADGTRYIDVQDPSAADDADDNRKSMSLNQLTANYDLVGGAWTWTYKTKP
jgi:hypothetical protein